MHFWPVTYSSDPRSSPDFSPRLRDKMWGWPGDEANMKPLWVKDSVHSIIVMVNIIYWQCNWELGRHLLPTSLKKFGIILLLCHVPTCQNILILAAYEQRFSLRKILLMHTVKKIWLLQLHDYPSCAILNNECL